MLYNHIKCIANLHYKADVLGIEYLNIKMKCYILLLFIQASFGNMASMKDYTISKLIFINMIIFCSNNFIMNLFNYLCLKVFSINMPTILQIVIILLLKHITNLYVSYEELFETY